MELKIIRIELLGEASKETYDKLHSYMETNKWRRVIYTNAKGQSRQGPLPLPTATYCNDSDHSCADIAEALNTEIKQQIWAKPRVLVMGVGANWAIRGY
jgi:hypothetical protein